MEKGEEINTLKSFIEICRGGNNFTFKKLSVNEISTGEMEG
jgi:hypothetical protein